MGRTETREGATIMSDGVIRFDSPPRFRCRKGHVSEGKHVWVHDGRSVQYCPTCYLDLIERESGGMQEVKS